MGKIDDNTYSVKIPSSFVKSTNKILGETGSGEAKLFIGGKNNSEEITSFFNDFSNDNKYFFCKNEVLDYLTKMFLEYKYNFFQKYKKINEEIYNHRINELNKIPEETIDLQLEKYVDKDRVYIRSNNKSKNKWNLITREIALPKITELIFEKVDNNTYHLNLKIDIQNQNSNTIDSNNDLILNKIYYGAPGTGKSYEINNDIRKVYPNYDPSSGNEYVFRITLHPEYTYSDFVGQWMPYNDGETPKYKFIPGIFTIALKKAIVNEDKTIYLILEEMSRSNVAAIFGDLFQLLDRKNGISEYAIDNPDIANQVYGNPHQKIAIPSNMIILGTVNTNDQNVFVMDTAFKRRFNWQYISTLDGANSDNFINKNNPKINIGENQIVSWKQLYQALNRFIVDDLKLNEDKQIGPYFIKFEGKNDEEAHDLIKEKLLQYLWQDINISSNSIYSTDITLFDSNIKCFSDLYSNFNSCKKIFSDIFLKKLGDMSES